MKTGILNEPLQTQPDETMLNFMSVFTLFTEDALIISSRYSKHSGRDVVGTEDIIYGLKTRFKHRSFYEQQNNVLERLTEIKTEFTSNTEYNIIDDINVSETQQDVNFIESKCECEICQMVNDTIQTWDNYIENNYESLSEADKSIIFAINRAEEKMIELNN